MFQLTFGHEEAAGGTGQAPGVVLVQDTQPESTAGAGSAATQQQAKSGGMPQLEFGDFAPQLIWLAITFVLLLILMSKVAMPRVASAIEQRAARIKGDLDRAERVKIEADAALTAYQKTVADARAKAQSELRQSQAASAAEMAKREAAFAQQLAQRTKVAEDGIAEAKKRALADLRAVGAGVAGNLLGKVAGLNLPAAQVQAAVDAAMAER
jgi:F-type H+-transporting ATPase subunit b